MSATLQPYVPDLLIHLLQRQRKHMHTHAAALFADVSGFTAMTEAFATHGNAGAEELTGVINRFFEALIKIVGQHGGDIVSFGGDALAIAFRGPPSRRRQLTQLAYHCAIAMQQEAQAYTQVHTRCGNFALSIKIGLSFGALNAQIVEDDTGQARFLVGGDALLWAGQAEQQAGRGEVMRHISVEPTGDTFVPPRTQINVSPTTPKLVEGEEGSLQRFIPPALAERVLSGQGTLVNEHRNVTVMFVGLRRPSRSLRPTRSIESTTMTIVHQFDGNVTRLDSGDKGLRVLALFGAPVMHQDDAERATRCALTLLAELGGNARIGIATGTLFCGDVGATQRHEYTVMGDAVNIAARLMQHAGWGQALVDEATQAGATSSITWQPLPPLQLKGKSTPTPCFQPIAQQDSSGWSQPESLSPHTNTPLIGRAPEQALLLDIVQRAGQGQCQSIVIQG